MGRPPQDEMERFGKYISISDTGCHLFTAAKRRDGYCRFFLRGKNMPAHVAAHVLFVGPVPAGAMICHHCDVRNCVNPNHLYVGTAKSNVADMHRRGRYVGRRKLSDMQVRVIRRLLETSVLSQEQIAKPFGVKQVAVSRVKLGQHQYLGRIG